MACLFVLISLASSVNSYLIFMGEGELKAK